MARASAFQAEGREFESRLPLHVGKGSRGSVVEHSLGKGEVVGSTPIETSTLTGERVLAGEAFFEFRFGLIIGFKEAD